MKMFKNLNIKSGYVILILTFFGILVYANCFNNQFLWDDEHYVYRNAYVKDFKYIKELLTQNVGAGAQRPDNFYRPIQMLSYSIIYHITGLKVFGFHLYNVGLHIGNAILIFFFLSRYVASPQIALITSLLFVVHPIYTEAVTYMNGTADPLYTIFFLSGLIMYAKHREQKKPVFAVLTMLFCVLSLFSKETAMVFPVNLILYELYQQKFKLPAADTTKLTDKKKKVNKTVKEKITLKKLVRDNYAILICFMIVAVYFMLRLTVLNFQDTMNFYGEKNIYTENLHYRIFTFIKTLPVYYGLLFFPLHLHMERTIPVSVTIDGNVLFSIILLSAVIWIVVKSHKKQPAIMFGAAWFYLSLAPVSGIIPINIFLSEHWLYLPSIGAFLTVSSIYVLITNRRIKQILTIAGCVWIIFLAVRTIYRNKDWHDPITFYEQTLKYAPWSTRVINNLAMAYDDKGEIKKSIDLYKNAIARQDIYPETHHNLANSYLKFNQVEEAIQEYKKAIAMSPTFIHSYKRLALLYINLNRFDEAVPILDTAQKLYPGDLDISNMMKFIQKRNKK